MFGSASHSHTPHDRVHHLLRQLMPHSTSASDAPTAEFVSPLDEERAAASFPVRSLTHWLDGGEAITSIKELVQASIEQDAVLNDENRYDLTREESRRRVMAKIAQVVSVIRGRNSDVAADAAEGKSHEQPTSEEDRSSSRAGAGRSFEDAFYGCLASLDPSWSIRIGVHFGLFQSAVTGSGTEEQRKKYARDIQEMRIIGCFAMTEMGHGSYLQGLETTATYDKTRQEFIIHSPTVTSTKWWIGMAGQTATHAAVFAKLILDGKDCGIQTFIVPIRSLETGKPVENVEVGDMGSKMGRNGLDNGWIRFHHKRIPRDSMLMRWSQVSPAGEFTPPPSKQIAYNALIGTRVELFKYCAEELKKALTITVRYSLVRRQSPRADGKPGETKLLDYPTHQSRILPVLAHCFVLHCTAIEIQRRSEVSLKDLESSLSALPQLHATSSGLKAIGTWYTNSSLEVLRQCLGGMGYSTYAVIPGMKADFAVQCTWEGDNTVLSLQCARFLVKSYVNMSKSRKQAGDGKAGVSGVTAYLATTNLNEKSPVIPDSRYFDAEFQLRSFQHRSARMIQSLARSLDQEVKKSNCSYAIAFERCSSDSLPVTRAHVYTFMLECMLERIQTAPKELQPILKRLCDLFVLDEIRSHASEFLEDGYLNGTHIDQTRSLTRQLLTSLRPDALSLVDSFNLPDFVIESPLGRCDGDVYNKLFQQVKAATRAQGVPTYFDELIRPLTDPKYTPPVTNQ